MMSGGPTLQQVTIGGGSGQQGGMGGPVAPQQQGQAGDRIQHPQSVVPSLSDRPDIDPHDVFL